jgi:hypothetical protein
MLWINLDNFPYGWTNEERHNGHENVITTVGDLLTSLAHLVTHSRVNMPTQRDSEGVIIENDATITQFILAGDVSIADYDDIVYALAQGIWGNDDPEYIPTAGQIAAVELNVTIEEKTEQECIGIVDGNPAAWNERV